MSFTYDTANKLAEQGEFGALRQMAEPYLGNPRTIDPSTLVLVAHALVYTGEGRRALSLLATLNLESGTVDLNRSRARLVLGLANRAAGSMTIALSQLQRAHHLAQESGSLEDIAWAHVYLFRHMIDSHPVDLAPAMLPAVKASVAKTGSSHILAFLHQSVAVLEGHNGRLREALRHCERAESLLSLSPNAWLHCGNQQNRAAILAAQCQFAEALRILEPLRRTALLHGLTNDVVKAESNIGHVLWATGEHGQAIEMLRRVVAAPSTSRLASIYALESIAQAHLWRGEFERCEEVLKEFESAAAQDAELASNYALRRTALTKARLLLSTDRAEEAIDYLAHVEERYRGTTDATGLSILTSQALARCGRFSEASYQLNRAEQLGVTSIREAQGRFYDAAAAVVANSDRGLASALAGRATAIWHVQGTGWMRAHASPHTSPDHSKLSPLEAINRLASTIDLAYDPRLAVPEALCVLESLGCRARAGVGGGDSSRSTGEPKCEVMSLGAIDGEVWQLECERPSDPAKALVLNDIVRILRAAFALESFKASAHSQTAFWPPEQELGEDGALFLSSEMRSLVETATRIAATDVPVLITGETGTGKEVLARLIHSKSPRARKTFLPFNCTTVPREMMDSQLFGHRRGAFTGANDNFQGVIRSARGGTLLLDEIGDLDLRLQPKLLRFLESGEILPLGESGPVQADVRVIAATNVDLDAAVSNGQFREDLYYRLNIVQLRVPPLRQRRDEIPSLSRHYLQTFAARFNKAELRLGEETIEHLVMCSWPGNIRQLANEMRRLAALAEAGTTLMPEALSPEISRARPVLPQASRTVDSDELLVRLDQPISQAVEVVEKAMLQFAMQRHDGHVEAVAKALGLSRKGLYLKRQRYRVHGLAPSAAAQVSE
jgi:DNA-binding NtrC family response regulator/tetratricopeptide (TPR) repeat protein